MKERLDVLLVKRGLAPSREKAKAVIMTGEVYVDGRREDKAGSTFPEEVPIEVRGEKPPFVSRGGLKLQKALEVFHYPPAQSADNMEKPSKTTVGDLPAFGAVSKENEFVLPEEAAGAEVDTAAPAQSAGDVVKSQKTIVDDMPTFDAADEENEAALRGEAVGEDAAEQLLPAAPAQKTRKNNLLLVGKVCADIGASTGGFTDCMLQHGAARVYAIDVGRGQLAWKLRQDPRVICMEKTNIRYVVPEDLPEAVDFATIDVSFISLTMVLKPVRDLLKMNADLTMLIKPQFEAGREKVGRKGVVRDKDVHKEVIRKVVNYAAEIGFSVLEIDYSPIKGPEGNIEYLLHARKCGDDEGEIRVHDPENIADLAFEALK